MDLPRRDLLKLAAVGAAGGLAGCGSDASVSTSGPSSDSTASPATDTNASRTFSLGETAVFSAGDGEELSFTPTSATVNDALIYASGDTIYSDVPESGDQTYLTVTVRAENTGTESIELPEEPVVTLDGSQYESTFTSAYSDSRYEAYQELQPGVGTTSVLVYPVAYADATASLIADFSTFGSEATATWNFETGSLTRETYDYSERAPNEDVVIGTEQRQFSLTALSVEETESYTYTLGSGYEYTEEASGGNKLVLVSIEGENTGSATVSIPTVYDFSLVSETSQYDAGFYQNDDDAYDGGAISAGVVRNGIVQFEVPESTSSYSFRASLTSDIEASWEF